MQHLLALDMEEAKAWSFLIGGILVGIASILGVIINGVQGYLNSRKLDVAHNQREDARVKAEASEVKIDKTLSNTNGKLHKLLREVSSLKTENTSLKRAASKKEPAKKRTQTR